MRKMLFAALVAAAALMGCQKDNAQPIPQESGQAARMMQYTEEIKTLEGILQKDPENLGALTGLGNRYMDLERFAEAIPMYEKALAKDPTNTNVRVDMGTCYRRTGRSDRAVQEYRKAIEYQPNHPNANLNLGVVLMYDFGNGAEARPYFEKYLEIAPTSPQVPAVRAEIEKIKAQASK